MTKTAVRGQASIGNWWEGIVGLKAARENLVLMKYYRAIGLSIDRRMEQRRGGDDRTTLTGLN